MKNTRKRARSKSETWLGLFCFVHRLCFAFFFRWCFTLFSTSSCSALRNVEPLAGCILFFIFGVLCKFAVFELVGNTRKPKKKRREIATVSLSSSHKPCNVCFLRPLSNVGGLERATTRKMRSRQMLFLRRGVKVEEIMRLTPTHTHKPAQVQASPHNDVMNWADFRYFFFRFLYVVFSSSHSLSLPLLRRFVAILIASSARLHASEKKNKSIKKNPNRQ